MSAATHRFVPNPAMVKQLQLDRGYIGHLQAVGGAIVEQAKSLVRFDHGDLHDSIGMLIVLDVESSGDIVCRVRATDYKAVWIEYGTGRPGPTPPFPFLRPAAEGFGNFAEAYSR